jgi:hypothetical protein
MREINIVNQRIMLVFAFPNEPLKATVLMTLIAMGALNVCSAKTVQFGAV